MIQLINIVKKVCLKKDYFWIVLSHFQAFKAKTEGSYQSSGLDLYCYVLVLNDVHVLI